MKEVDLSQAMKEGMRRLASGVSVITCFTPEGDPCAMTATSITSLSDNPASLLVCVNRDTHMYQTLTASVNGVFGVNLLGSDHEEVSNLCAFGDPGPSRFKVGDWSLQGEAPTLNSGLATFICHKDQLIDYGTHGILIGRINTVLINEERPVDPLLYLNGGYSSAS